MSRKGSSRGSGNRGARFTTETKPAYKTTELIVYAAAVIGVIVTGLIVEELDVNRTWLYLTILTVGYLLSRGLAKSGSYEPDHDGDE
jgi:hypothetical protein